MSLGQKLKKVRSAKQLSMTDLISEFQRCFGLNVTRSMISRWEHDLTSPSNAYLAAYAKYFNLDMNELLGIDLPTHTARYSSILNRAQKELSAEDLKSVEDLAEYLLNKKKGVTED